MELFTINTIAYTTKENLNTDKNKKILISEFIRVLSNLVVTR